MKLMKMKIKMIAVADGKIEGSFQNAALPPSELKVEVAGAGLLELGRPLEPERRQESDRQLAAIVVDQSR